MRFITALPCVIGVLVFAGSAAAQPPAPPVREPMVIPFEILDSGHMAIQVRVNGKPARRMIFDTGAPTVIVSGSVAKEAELIPEGAASRMLGSYSATSKPATIQVGDYRVEGIVPQVMDHPTVGALASKLGPIDGLIGFELFQPQSLTIDYRAQTMTVVLPAQEPRPFGEKDSRRQMQRSMLGRSTRPTLAPGAIWGFTVDKPSDDQAPGVVVSAVTEGGAAAEAGLRPGDRLLVLGHRWTDSVEDTYRAAAAVWPRKVVGLEIRRDGADLKLMGRPRAGL